MTPDGVLAAIGGVLLALIGWGVVVVWRAHLRDRAHRRHMEALRRFRQRPMATRPFDHCALHDPREYGDG